MKIEHKHKFAAVILAAGQGTRMKSELPKVLHKIAGQPMITHVQAAAKPLAPEKTIVVVAPGMDAVKAVLPGAAFAIQIDHPGTGGAALAAQAQQLKAYANTVLILCGDAPLITTQTLSRLLDASAKTDIVVLGMQVSDPTGYGRLITDAKGKLLEIVECRDASPTQKRVTLCNSGMMAINGKHLGALLAELKNKNAAKEYYLTDIVALANSKGLHAMTIEADKNELCGVNSRAQLAEAECVMQQRLRAKAMEEGATLIDPQTVYLSTDTKIGKDVIIHPNVVFGPGVSVADNVEIRSFCHIEGAKIESGAIIGPFARLRPGSVIGEQAHVGNFVELKQTKLGKGAKANHLSYVGDSDVGAGANIGAGTITCNYDGVAKHKTIIGKGSFIGSNTSLVAPVTIGEGAVVGAGSVITEDVPDEALAVARAPQVVKKSKAKEIQRTLKH